MNSPAHPWSKFGLTVDQYKILDELMIQPLKAAGAKVWIFGSRARGDHRPASDVDVLFEFPSDVVPPSGMIFSIKSDLEESRFPYTVDLVSVKDMAVSYKENVFRDRIII